MFTNQKVIAAVLILFVILAGGYFGVSKFKGNLFSGATPAPTPSAKIEFVLNAPAASQPPPQPQTSKPPQTPQPTPRPYFVNKNIGKFPGVLTADSLKNKKVVMQTNKGTIEIEIFTDSPIAASNFLLLSDGGFYDGLKFHRVEDWVVQGGDPTGTGRGGPGYIFQDEAVSRAYVRGIVAMANAGPNTNGSQFFILKKDYPLPPNYTIFGRVIIGMEVVDKLAVGDVMQRVTVEALK